MLTIGVWVLVGILTLAFWDRIETNLARGWQEFVEFIGALGFLALLLAVMGFIGFGCYWLYYHHNAKTVEFGQIILMVSIFGGLVCVSIVHIVKVTRSIGLNASIKTLRGRRGWAFWLSSLVIVYVIISGFINNLTLGFAMVCVALGIGVLSIHSELCKAANPNCGLIEVHKS